MATNQTEHYKLNQWELTDSVLMAEFNADNQKVDAALNDIHKKLDADLATLDRKLEDAVAQVKAAIPHIQTGTYVGTGTYGEDAPNTLTFEFTPKLVIVSQVVTEIVNSTICKYNTRFIAVYGTETCFTDYKYSANAVPEDLHLIWGETTLSWYSANAAAQGNEADIAYHYIAIG